MLTNLLLLELFKQAGMCVANMPNLMYWFETFLTYGLNIRRVPLTVSIIGKTAKFHSKLARL